LLLLEAPLFAALAALVAIGAPLATWRWAGGCAANPAPHRRSPEPLDAAEALPARPALARWQGQGAAPLVVG
jgi:hypothetical protein